MRNKYFIKIDPPKKGIPINIARVFPANIFDCPPLSNQKNQYFSNEKPIPNNNLVVKDYTKERIRIDLMEIEYE